MDIVDKKTRSRNMSRIRSRDTKPEIFVRKFLHSRGFRYRLNVRKLPGTPDIVMPKYRLAIMVHGCYWHRHTGCALATIPATNSERWRAKFEANTSRDKRNLTKLRNEGWRTLIIWECGLRQRNPDLRWLPEWIKGDEASGEWPEIK